MVGQIGFLTPDLIGPGRTPNGRSRHPGRPGASWPAPAPGGPRSRECASASSGAPGDEPPAETPADTGKGGGEPSVPRFGVLEEQIHNSLRPQATKLAKWIVDSM